MSFPAGELTTEVLVPLHGDTVDEPDETFTLSLRDPRGGVVIDPAASSTTVTLTDDDAAAAGGAPPQPPPSPSPPPTPPPPSPSPSPSPEASFVGKPRLSPAKPRRRSRIKVSFKLSAAGTVDGVVIRTARGIRKGKRCVAIPKQRPKGAKSCSRAITVRKVKATVKKAGSGSLSVGTLAVGTYTIKLSVRLGRGKTYTLPIVVRR